MLQDCERKNYQASGPGGQKRNRVYSAIRLTHVPTQVSVSAAEDRKADRNLKSAIRKLRKDLAFRGASEDFAGLEEGSAEEILAGLPESWPVFRAKVNPEHGDFPAFLYLALLLLRVCRGDVAVIAKKLGVSTSAFVRFCKLDGKLWQAVNELRVGFGLGRLK